MQQLDIGGGGGGGAPASAALRLHTRWRELSRRAPRVKRKRGLLPSPSRARPPRGRGASSWPDHLWRRLESGFFFPRPRRLRLVCSVHVVYVHAADRYVRARGSPTLLQPQGRAGMRARGAVICTYVCTHHARESREAATDRSRLRVYGSTCGCSNDFEDRDDWGCWFSIGKVEKC